MYLRTQTGKGQECNNVLDHVSTLSNGSILPRLAAHMRRPSVGLSAVEDPPPIKGDGGIYPLIDSARELTCNEGYRYQVKTVII